METAISDPPPERRGPPGLAGLRVVEFGVWVAAPSAAAVLADWGADVVKVESPRGDPMRHVFGSIGGSGLDGVNPPFVQDNRGKRSVVLDLRDEAELDTLHRLLAASDVFVSNLRPDALDAFGLDGDALLARHPHLVACLISGFGAGPERDRPSYDIGAFWARSGLTHQLTPAGAPPVNARGAIGDHVTALAALSGILGAVVDQRATGRGQVVDVSLLRTGLYCLGWDLGLQLELGRVAASEPRTDTRTPLMNSYEAGDGRAFFLMGLEGDRHLPPLYRALDRPDLADDPRYESARAVRRNRGAFIALLDEAFRTRPLAAWAERFDAAGVWWAPVASPAEVVVDPQVRAAGGIVDVPRGDGTTTRSINSPITFRRRPPAALGPSPELGEHTAEVVAEWGAAAPPPTDRLPR